MLSFIPTNPMTLSQAIEAEKPLRDAIPCELVIADTGSTDKTREIAEKYFDLRMEDLNRFK